MWRASQPPLGEKRQSKEGNLFFFLNMQATVLEFSFTTSQILKYINASKTSYSMATFQVLARHFIHCNNWKHHPFSLYLSGHNHCVRCAFTNETVELVSRELSHPSLLPSIRQATVSGWPHPACYCWIQILKVGSSIFFLAFHLYLK